MKLKRIKNNILQVGNVVYSNYTKKYYIVSNLPRIKDDSVFHFALVRFDGRGYFYLSKSVKELIDKMNMDGGETEAYEVLDWEITLNNEGDER